MLGAQNLFPLQNRFLSGSDIAHCCRTATGTEEIIVLAVNWCIAVSIGSWMLWESCDKNVKYFKTGIGKIQCKYFIWYAPPCLAVTYPMKNSSMLWLNWYQQLFSKEQLNQIWDHFTNWLLGKCYKWSFRDLHAGNLQV